jgi:hypothetical protein
MPKLLEQGSVTEEEVSIDTLEERMRSGAVEVQAQVDALSERLHEGIPDSLLVIFEESGHLPWLEEPDAFFCRTGAFSHLMTLIIRERVYLSPMPDGRFCSGQLREPLLRRNTHSPLSIRRST